LFQIYFTVVTFLTISRRRGNVEDGSLRWLPQKCAGAHLTFYLPWAVSQCPFDPYRAGAKVYWAYWAGWQPAPQTTLEALSPPAHERLKKARVDRG
jgi:hypothetical protein